MKEGLLPARVKMLLEGLPGEVGVCWHNFATGAGFSFQAGLPMVAASLIKLPALIEAFRAVEAGEADFEEKFILRPEDKLPSCGALKALHDGLAVTLHDLCALMIILGDNTAANLVIRRLGMDKINGTLHRMGARDSKLRRLLFDAEAAARGVENTVTAADMLRLLAALYRGEAVSPKASAAMLDILKDQRLNGKMPFWLPPGVACAHKTGEDGGITHDVGIVFGPQPFAFCFLSQKTDPPLAVRAMQDITRLVYESTLEKE